MRFIGSDVCFKCFLGTKIQEIVGLDELFELRLNVGDFVPIKIKFIKRHLGLLQIAFEAQLLGAED